MVRTGILRKAYQLNGEGIFRSNEESVAGPLDGSPSTCRRGKPLTSVGGNNEADPLDIESV